jgi:hypothetical protein
VFSYGEYPTEFLCIDCLVPLDPLLRNLNNSKNVKEIKINSSKFIFKAGAYADDVSQNSPISIQGVFDEYNRLTERSGLELNADKTEILKLNNAEILELKFKYRGRIFNILTVGKLKIRGLYFSSNIDEEYNLNVHEKIRKLTYKIKQWTPRHLTMEGKTLIVKTFGLSQLIYNMQSYGFRLCDLRSVEREILKFIWSTNENHNGIDRISRAVMKNGYEEGGMKVTDVECLDKSPKLRQFIRANKSNHVISKIQALVVGRKADENSLRQEYDNILDSEAICSSAQESLNMIIDYNREQYRRLENIEYETDKNLIDEVSSIDIKSYLTRKKRVFSLCILRPITRLGVITLGDLIQAYEHETDNNLNRSMEIVIGSFPKRLVEIAKCFNENINSTDSNLKYMLVTDNKRLAIETITTKELQTTLKIVLGRVDSTNFKQKLMIDDFDINNINTFRDHCKNAKLRNIYFRLIHNDFFTHSRMKKYNMTTTDKCPRCEQVETTKHLLWECNQAKHIWNLYNEYMIELGLPNYVIIDYKQVYTAGGNAGTTLIKIKTIQEMIQIKRPTNWNKITFETMVDNLVKIDLYNYKEKRQVKNFKIKWNFLKKDIISEQ